MPAHFYDILTTLRNSYDKFFLSELILDKLNLENLNVTSSLLIIFLVPIQFSMEKIIRLTVKELVIEGQTI
jgi:hypothetical protein